MPDQKGATIPLCARLTGIEAMSASLMQIGFSEPSGPESCAVARERQREALTGEDVGRVLSRVTDGSGMLTS
jgi:hypothetical protein